MMAIACLGRLLVGALGVLLTAAAPAPAQTVSLMAVRLNPECVGGSDEGAFCARDVDCESGVCGGAITPTNEVQALPGDVIVCDIYASDWSPDNLPHQRLKSYQIQIDGSQFGTDPPVMPLFWDCPDNPWPCEGPEDCAPSEICWGPEGILGFCAGPDHHPEDGSFIDSMRYDYIFAPAGSPPPEFKAVDLTSLSFWYASTLLQSILAPLYTPPAKYVGTFTLEVLPDACGTFVVGFKGDGETLFQHVDYQVSYPDRVGLEIETGGDSFGPVDCFPPNCAIDARQPTEPDGQSPAGWDAMTLTFDPYFDPCGLQTHDFSVREVPSPMTTTLYIDEVTCGHALSTLTVHLSRRTMLQTWTCIRYLPTSEEFCIAHLPGDVNGDGVASPADILYLIDSLNGIVSPAFEIWQTDIDRSGETAAPDVVRLIDMLNGAGSYETWLNKRLPMPCPSAP